MRQSMVAVMIGVDPHKGSHIAVVIDQAETVLGEVRVRASASRVERLLAWAGAWPERTLAVEGAGGWGTCWPSSWPAFCRVACHRANVRGSSVGRKCGAWARRG